MGENCQWLEYFQEKCCRGFPPEMRKNKGSEHVLFRQRRIDKRAILCTEKRFKAWQQAGFGRAISDKASLQLCPEVLQGLDDTAFGFLIPEASGDDACDNAFELAVSVKDRS